VWFLARGGSSLGGLFEGIDGISFLLFVLSLRSLACRGVRTRCRRPKLFLLTDESGFFVTKLMLRHGFSFVRFGCLPPSLLHPFLEPDKTGQLTLERKVPVVQFFSCPQFFVVRRAIPMIERSSGLVSDLVFSVRFFEVAPPTSPGDESPYWSSETPA